MLSSRASLCIAPLLMLLLFAPALSGQRRLAFRDVSFFYTPLYDYVAARTHEEWLPTWNPLDQTGLPLLGETTTAVLYPVRYLLFAMPIRSEVAIAWYVVLHLILASLTASLAARWAGATTLASSLAGILYSLSGSVLFLYTNPPFLVGAAWLPLVLGVMLSRQLTDGRTRILVAAPSLAMMILGGDPQTALHAMLVVAVYYLIQRLRGCAENFSFGAFLAVGFVAALLSAPQLAASVDWARQSERVVSAPSGHWLDPPTGGTRRHESYAFSLPPWHVAELATPNPSGSLLPIYRRLSHLLDGDGRMWTPTIYMGGLLIAVIAGLPLGVQRSALDRWAWTAAITLWLCMGHFGVVWAVQSMTAALMNVDSAAGGPYWLLYMLLPGYDSFRYPAKWLPVFALSASIWTARMTTPLTLVRISARRMATIAAILLAAFGIVTLLRIDPGWITGRIGRLPSDEYWGPLDVPGGLAELQSSVIHTIVVLAAIIGIVSLRLKSAVKIWLLLLVVTIDLGIANHHWIATISSADEQHLLEQVDDTPPAVDSRWIRKTSGDGWPVDWNTTSDPDRLLDVEASQRRSRFGRWHLDSRTGMLNSTVSIRSQSVTEFWQAITAATADMDPQATDQFWRGLQDWLGIDGVLRVSEQTRLVPVHDRQSSLIDMDETFRQDRQPLRFEPHLTERLLGSRNQVAFADRLLQIAQGDLGSAVDCSAIDSAQQAIFRDVKLSDPGLIRRPVLQDGHWAAAVATAGNDDWQPVEVHVVDQVQQGVFLPAGKWDLKWQYRPSWLLPALVICGISWISLLVAARW